MLHEVFKDIFADLFGLRRRGATARPVVRQAPLVSPLDDDWPSPIASSHRDDPLAGIFNHYQNGAACDIYGNPV